MKNLLLILCFCLSLIPVRAQYTDTVVQYYDYRWQQVDPAVTQHSFFRIARKTEGIAWLVKDYYAGNMQLQKQGLYMDDSFTIEEGQFYYYYYNGNLQAEGNYYQGQRVGLWREYSIGGKLMDSTRYKHTGIPFGKSYRWDYKGNTIFYGEYDKDGNGTGYETEYHAGGNISSFGKYVKGYVKDSVWMYFHSNGKKALRQVYGKGKLLSYACYDLKGTRQDKCDTGLIPASPGYDVYAYIQSKIKIPEQQMADTTAMQLVYVSFYVDEEGTVTDADIYRDQYNEALADEALKVIKTLPRWQPCTDKNRRIKVPQTIPILFSDKQTD